MAWHAGLAAAMLALGSGIGLRQLARSNRPHELTAAPYVAVLLAVSIALSVLGLVRLLVAWRARERHPVSRVHGLLAAALVLLAGIGTLLFLAAAVTAIEILSD